MSPATLPDSGFESGRSTLEPASYGSATPGDWDHIQSLYNEEYYRCGAAE
jgi:hypothetical protein